MRSDGLPGAAAGVDAPYALAILHVSPSIPSGDTGGSLRARYQKTVAATAEVAMCAAPPMWSGDGALLLFRDRENRTAPQVCYETGRELLERALVDLGLSVRVVLHVTGPLRPGAPPDPGPATLQTCRELAESAPADVLLASEDYTLVLGDPAKGRFALLGRHAKTGLLAFCSPMPPAEAIGKDFVRDDDTAHRAAFRAYLESPEIRRLGYVGFRLQKAQPPSLDVLDVFVPLKVQVTPRRSDARLDARWLAADEGESALPEADAGESATDSPAEDFPWLDKLRNAPGDSATEFAAVFSRYRRLVVIGEPGTGKTTLLRWLAVVFSLGPYGAFARLGTWERVIPLPVSVGRLAEIRERHGGGLSVEQALAKYYLERNVRAADTRDAEADLRGWLERRLDAGECLLLLDGLDEVGSNRLSVVQWIQSFVSARAGNRVLLTSRPAAYVPFAVGEYAEVTLEPFDDRQVERYLRGFRRALGVWETGVDDPVRAEGVAQELLSTLRTLPRLQALARNPFLLSALALIHRAEGELPRHRVHVYEIFSRALCETWGKARRIVAGSAGPQVRYEEEAIPILGRLALRMHEEWPRGRAPAAFVRSVLAEALQEEEGLDPQAAESAARKFLETVGDELQILRERSAGEWGFFHLTFQEFFAAAGLHAMERFEEKALEHLFDPRWEEVIRLGVGYLALVQKRPVQARKIVARVLEVGQTDPPPVPKWLVTVLRKQVPLAALLAAEAGDTIPAPEQERIAGEFVNWWRAMPDEISQRFVAELALTDWREVVAKALLQEIGAERLPSKREVNLLQRLRATAGLAAVLRVIREGEPEAALEAFQVEGVWPRTPEVEEAFRAGLARVDDLSLSAICGGILRAGGHPIDVAGIAKDLDSTDDERKVRALFRLGWLGADEFLDRIIDATRDARSGIRVAAVQALSFFRSPDSMAALVRALGDESPDVRESAVASLHWVAPADHVHAFLTALEDTHPRVREAAADVLAQLRTPESIAPLLAALNDQSVDVHTAAADALGAFQPAEVFVDLAWAASCGNARAAHGAVWALGRLGVKEAVPILVDSLTYPNRNLRLRAIYVLGRVGSNAEVRPLRALLDDPDLFIRSATTISLLHLGDLGVVNQVPALLSALARTAERDWLRKDLLAALGSAFTEEAAAILIPFARSETPEELRTAALLSLWRSADAFPTKVPRRSPDKSG